MPGTTGGGYPYPLPTEPVRDGAQRIRELAEATDWRMGVFIECTRSSAGNVGTAAWSQLAVPDLVRERDPANWVYNDPTSPLINQAGWWDILLMVRWSSSTAGRRALGWVLSQANPSPPSANQSFMTASATGNLTQTFRDLAFINNPIPGRILPIVYQDSGATLTIDYVRIVARYAGASVNP